MKIQNLKKLIVFAAFICFAATINAQTKYNKGEEVFYTYQISVTTFWGNKKTELDITEELKDIAAEKLATIQRTLKLAVSGTAKPGTYTHLLKQSVLWQKEYNERKADYDFLKRLADEAKDKKMALYLYSAKDFFNEAVYTKMKVEADQAETAYKNAIVEMTKKQKKFVKLGF